jgi:hypothetical protein
MSMSLAEGQRLDLPAISFKVLRDGKSVVRPPVVFA